VKHRIRDNEDASGESSDDVDVDIIVSSHWLGREEQEIFQKAEEDGWGEGAREMMEGGEAERRQRA